MKPTLVALILLCSASVSPMLAQTSPGGKLVPATFSPKTDALGFVWDLDQQGTVNQGSNSCFSNAFQMEVNNNTFSATQSLMTPDGSEYFLSNNLNGVEVTRRIKVDVKNGLIRFVETFRNMNGAPAQVPVQITATLNNRLQSVLSDLGAPVVSMLGPKESGILAVRGPNQQQPSVLFYLAGASAKIKPTIRNNSNYRLDFIFALNLNAGETVSILHGAAQRTLVGAPDPKMIAALFAPFKLAKFSNDIPAKDRKLIANLGAGGSGVSLGGAEMPAFTAPLDRLGVERGATDVLAIGEETRLRGSASCAAFSVQSQYGAVQTPFEKVAGIKGGPRQSSVYLRDGQSLSGKITVQDLKFTMPTGTAMNLDITGLDRLVLRAKGGAEDEPAAGAWGWIETHSGDRLAILPDAAFRIRAITPWGVREISTDELLWLSPAEDNPLGYRVVLKDGSRFFALLDGDDLTVKTQLFGVKKLPVADLRAIVAAQAKAKPDEETDQPDKAQAVIVGDQALSGRLDLAELHFITAGEVVPISPATIKTLRNTADEKNPGAGFVAELWGGGTVAGALRETVLPVRTGDALQRVPTQDVIGYTQPAPAIPDNLRDKIANLIRDLGHPEWEKREAASRDLGELGTMARQQLAEAVKQTPDAEVRRRAQALLDEAP